MSRELFETIPSQEQKESKRRFLVLSNVSGQSFKEYTWAKGPEDAINRVARRLQRDYPGVSYLAANFKKKAKAIESPSKEED